MFALFLFNEIAVRPTAPKPCGIIKHDHWIEFWDESVNRFPAWDFIIVYHVTSQPGGHDRRTVCRFVSCFAVISCRHVQFQRWILNALVHGNWLWNCCFFASRLHGLAACFDICWLYIMFAACYLLPFSIADVIAKCLSIIITTLLSCFPISRPLVPDRPVAIVEALAWSWKCREKDLSVGLWFTMNFVTPIFSWSHRIQIYWGLIWLDRG